LQTFIRNAKKIGVYVSILQLQSIGSFGVYLNAD
jgi:hypothetical protein